MPGLLNSDSTAVNDMMNNARNQMENSFYRRLILPTVRSTVKQEKAKSRS